METALQIQSELWKDSWLSNRNSKDALSSMEVLAVPSPGTKSLPVKCHLLLDDTAFGTCSMQHTCKQHSTACIAQSTMSQVWPCPDDLYEGHAGLTWQEPDSEGGPLLSAAGLRVSRPPEHHMTCISMSWQKTAPCLIELRWCRGGVSLVQDSGGI